MLNDILVDGLIDSCLRSVIRIVLGLTLKSIPLCVELLGIVFQEHVVLMDPHFDVFEVPDVLIFKKLVLSEPRLLHGHDELLAVPDDIVGEIGPFELRLVEHLLAVSFLLLQDDHVLLHQLDPV